MAGVVIGGDDDTDEAGVFRYETEGDRELIEEHEAEAGIELYGCQRTRARVAGGALCPGLCILKLAART